MRGITRLELAQWLPNNRGGRGVHPKTIGRMVKREELPRYDFAFASGIAGWSGDTATSDPRIAPFIPTDIDAPAAPSKRGTSKRTKKSRRA